MPLWMELADMSVLEIDAPRRVSSSLTKGTIFPRIVKDNILVYETSDKSSILFEEA